MSNACTNTIFTNTLQVAELQLLLATPQHVVLFDCRHDLAKPDWGAAQYAAGHLVWGSNSAQFANLDTDLSAAKTGRNGRHPLPDRNAFIAWLAAKGVTPTSQVVCYDQIDGMFAARLWWMCRWAGLHQVAVLAGGYPAWLAAGGAVSAAIVEPTPQATWHLPALETVLSTEEVLNNLTHPKFTLIDARAPERYRGEVEPMDPVAGHIPAAKNHFFKRNVTADGSFTEQMRPLWQATLNQQSPTQFAHSCGSGATACHNILALHVAGLVAFHEPSKLYAGSWSEWCSNPARPIAKG